MQRFGWALAALTVSVGLGGCGGGTKSPTPPALTTQGVARFDVDVATGKVTISKLDTTRAVYSGSAVSFTSSDLISVGGDAGKRLIRVTAKNNSGEAWGSSPVRMVVSGIENASMARVRESIRVTTLAGSGDPATLDGLGSAARFNSPYGIAAGQGAGAHGLFVGEFYGHVIRRAEVSGAVTTVAGSPGVTAFADGTGTAARFNTPNCIATDAVGNIFVADNGNNRIRRITPAYEVTTIAGTGVDGTANGSGDVATLSSPAGIACSADGNRVYASMSGTNNIRLITFTGTRRDQASSYTVTTVAGSSVASGLLDGIGTAARFNYPRSLALMTDAAGAETLFVADYFNAALRRIESPGSATARVTTVAGDGVAGAIDGPGSVARLTSPRGVTAVPLADGEFDVYFSAANQIRVAHFSAGGDPRQKGAYIVSTLAGEVVSGSADGNGYTARLNAPAQIAATTLTGASTTLYVTDWGGNRIRVVTVPTGAFHSGGALGTSTEAVGLANYDAQVPNRDAYTKEMAAAGDGYTADLQFQIPSGVSGFSFQATIETDSSVINVPGQGASYVTTIAGNGLSAYRDGVAKTAQFAYPCGVAAVPAALRSLYRTSSGKPVRAFVCDTDANAVRWIDTSGTVGTFAGGIQGFADGVGTSARFTQPFGVAIDPEGTLWVTDMSNGRVRRILPNGTVFTVAGSGSSGGADGTGATAAFTAPMGIAVDTGGLVFVTDYLGNTIRQIRYTGGDVRSAASYRVDTVAGLYGTAGTTNGQGAGARFDSPTSIAAAEDGRLFVTDAGNGSVRLLSPMGSDTSMAVTTLASGLVTPSGVTLSRTRDAYVTTLSPSIVRISPSGLVTALTSGVGFIDGPSGGLGHPSGIALEESGTLLFTDPGYRAVRCLQRSVTSTPL